MSFRCTLLAQDSGFRSEVIHPSQHKSQDLVDKVKTRSRQHKSQALVTKQDTPESA